MKLIEHPFSIQHLPYGIVMFGRHPHLCVRFENWAVSLDMLSRAHLLKPVNLSLEVTQAHDLNPLLALSREDHRLLRERLVEVISKGHHLQIEDCCKELAPYPQDDPQVLNPLKPQDFVDFYCSRHHAFRVGSLFRGPEQALPDQYFALPIGYHGRCSTLFCSDTPIHRPEGILPGDPPQFGPSQRLDYELEVGFVLRGRRGRVSPDRAWELIFGVVLVNDWSARDIQAFEYKPLGPFLGKSFATSLGAWVTPIEALEPWREKNSDSDHSLLPHLQESANHHLNLGLSAHLSTAMGHSLEICESNLNHLAWSAAQMVSHLSSNGTVITPGDLIATGTISGPKTGSEACLLERTQGGKQPLVIGSESRTFLIDGDTITLLGGQPGVGLAPCRGVVVAPLS